jgi:WD40 repeat protein
MGRILRSIVFLTAAACCMSVTATAQGAFPGANGKINFTSDRSPGGAYFMNPDGSAPTGAPVVGIWSPDASHVLRYCDNAFCVFRADGTFESDHYFAAAMHGMGWSPDGTKIIHAEQSCGASVCDPDRILYQGYPSGPGATVTSQDDLQPAWSPDGARIAFISFRDNPRGLFLDPPPPPGSTDLYLIKVDGTGLVRLTNSPGFEGGPVGLAIDDFDERTALPSWSPNGTKIAVASNRDGNWEIYVVNADGSGAQRLTNNPGSDWRPVWSPDGTKIAFQTDRDGNNEIYSMNPDGSGQTNLTHNAASDVLYDWLSIPVNAYPRPRGAGPTRVYLVPAKQPCTAPNRTHGAPLAYGSCSLPAQTSSQLTVGTPDANGAGAKSIAEVRYSVRPGNLATPADEADLSVSVTVSDVRRLSGLGDYAGELQLSADLRITDRDNTPHPGGAGPATLQDRALTFTVPCAATADATIGSSCSLHTTADAVYPGIVKEGKLAVWQLGQVKAYDGGADGLASTTPGNTVFLTQGVFVP